MMTMQELKERMAQELDEVTLLEVLHIRSHDLVEAFEDKILDRFEQLEAEFGDEQEDE